MAKTTVMSLHQFNETQRIEFQSGDPRYVYIGRAHNLFNDNLKLKNSIWANKHDGEIAELCKHRKFSIREAMQIICDRYREDVLANPKLMAALPTLLGKTLVCFCHNSPCHGHVLIELLETL